MHGSRAVNRGEVTGRASLNGANMKTEPIKRGRYVTCLVVVYVCMYVCIFCIRRMYVGIWRGPKLQGFITVRRTMWG